MLAWIRGMWRGYRQGSEAIRCATRAFRERYPEHRPGPPINPARISDSEYVVTVPYGDTLPPERSWWHVYLHTGEAAELTFEEARALIHIPEWR